MKIISTLLIAASTLAFINVAQAQSTSADASVAVTTIAPALYSNDPFIQKRHADSVAQKEYTARKKAAKKEMKAEQKEARIDLKADLSTAKDARDTALTVEAAVIAK